MSHKKNNKLINKKRGRKLKQTGKLTYKKIRKRKKEKNVRSNFQENAKILSLKDNKQTWGVDKK